MQIKYRIGIMPGPWPAGSPADGLDFFWKLIDGCERTAIDSVWVSDPLSPPQPSPAPGPPRPPGPRARLLLEADRRVRADGDRLRLVLGPALLAHTCPRADDHDGRGGRADRTAQVRS